MGLAASQGRLMMLTARRSDLELQLQFINQARMQLSNVISNLARNFAAVNASMDPGQGNNNQTQQTNASSQLQAGMTAVQQQDKVLEMEANRINTQREAVVAEIDSVRKVISKNIAGSFGTFARG